KRLDEAHGSKNVFSCGWSDLRSGGAVPPGADFHGVDRHHRGLVDTDVGELDRPRCRGWALSYWVETQRAITRRASDSRVPKRSCSARFNASIWNGFLRVGRSR